MCQINSVPMKYAIGYLDVLTPPVFEDANTGETTTLQPGEQLGTVIVREGANATLNCRASGHPTPQITWRREDNEPILLNGNLVDSGQQAKIEAPSLNLTQVSRLNSGAYLCIASNGVQPSASKRQVLDVQFRPVIQLPQVEVGAALRQKSALLTCQVELNPAGSYHWAKLPKAEPGFTGGFGAGQAERDLATVDDVSLIEHDEITNSDKYEVVIKPTNSERIQMSLLIRNVERQDFGWFKCIARNALGIQSSSIRLFEQSQAELASSVSSSSPSSSFSLDSIFRLSSSNGHSETDHRGSPAPKPGHTQTRTHTRSSWVSRSAGSSATSQSSSASTSALLNPLLPFHRTIQPFVLLVVSLLLCLSL